MSSIAIISNQAFSLINFRGSLIERLVHEGHTVTTFCPDYSDTEIAQINELGATPIEYQLSRTGLNPIADIATILELKSKLGELRPDASLAYFAKPVIYGSISARLANVGNVVAMIEGLGYVFTEQNGINIKRLFLRAITTILYRIGLKSADHVVFLNNDDIEDFCRKRIVSRAKCNMFGAIGVNLDHWHYTQPPIDPVSFIIACRMLKEKGVYEFVRVARMLKKVYPEARFILAGGTDSNPGSISESELLDWNNEGAITWVGHVSIKDWLHQSSVFVLPSFYREGVPRSIQEAQACGRPTITTDTPGCRDTVEDGYNGFLIPPNNEQALYSAMEFFLVHPEKIHEMGRNARKFAEKNFDQRAFEGKLIELLKRNGG